MRSSSYFDFSDYITERTRDFVGREWVFADIDAWLADPDAPRFFLITGEPGIGKTAIAARLTQIRDLDAYHFCIARQADTIDPLDFARSLSRQLTAIDDFAISLLEEQGVYVEARMDVRHNYGQMINVHIDCLSGMAQQRATTAFNRIVTNPLKLLYINGFDRQLVILVDALDEAAQLAGTETIVDLLANARGLPPQVRFVLTSRLEGQALRHFELLEIPRLVLDAGDARNCTDVREYVFRRVETSDALRTRLAEKSMATSVFVAQVTKASEGNFLYLVWLLRGIRAGTHWLDDLEALPQGLDSVYREFLRTRSLGKDLDPWNRDYSPLLGVLAAAQSPLTVDQLSDFTHLSRQRVKRLLTAVQQFLAPLSALRGQYRLYHQSVVDFLADEERAGEFWIDVAAHHQKIAGHYWDNSRPDWSKCDQYGLLHLPYHLKQAGLFVFLETLLSDYRWLTAKIRATDTVSLLDDFAMAQAASDLARVRRAVELSAHVLVRDRDQLGSQLMGRLSGQESVGVQSLLEQARALAKPPWLQPLVPSLTSPDSPLLRTLEGHASGVNAVAVTSDSRYVASASSDKTVRTWDLERYTQLDVLVGHSGSVNAVTFLPSTHCLLSASDDCTLRIWDVRTGELKGVLSGHSGWVRDVAALHNGRYAISAAQDNTLKLWELGSQKEVSTFRGHSSGVISVAVTPDDRYVISGSTAGTLKIWDLARQAVLHSIKAHELAIQSITVTPDSNYILTGSSDSTIRVWSLARGECVGELTGHNAVVNSIVTDADGQHVISASWDHTIRIWNLEDGTQIGLLRGHASGVLDVATAHSRHTIISASDDRMLKVWDISQNPLTRRTEGHSSAITAVAIAPDGRLVISASRDGTLKLWDSEQQSIIRTLRGHNSIVKSVAVTSDGQQAVSAGEDRALRLWDLKTGNLVFTMEGHSSGVNSVTTTRDGRWCLSASGSLSPSSISLGSVFSPSEPPDNSVRVWDLGSGRELFALQGHKDWVRDIIVVPDGKRAVSACWDGTLKIWNLATRTELCTLEGHSNSVEAVASAPKGNTLVSASLDNTLRVWDLQRCEEVRVLREYDASVKDVRITSDGKHVVSVCSDASLFVLDLTTGRILARFDGDAAFFACDVSGDNSRIAVGDALGNLHVLKLGFPPST